MKLILGDCLEKLKELEDNSIDLIATDPPYQLDSIRERFGKKNSAPPVEGVYRRSAKGFMGKEWDILPPVEVWKECLRVLKPGAFAFVMTTPRQDSLCQILMDLSQAGFCMGFSSIYWSYATGFPKASNIGKMVDKRLGKKRKIKGIKKTPSGQNYPTCYEHKDTPVPFKRSNGLETEPVSEKAKELDGSYAGFQPKPAVEIIIVAMKPLSEKSYVDQVLKNGKGITNLDSCKIPYKSGKPESGWSKSGADGTKGYQGTDTFKIRKMSAEEIQDNVKNGRFPPNLLCSDDSLNDGRISKGQQCATTGEEPSTRKRGNVYGDYSGYGKQTLPRNDEGSYSRYFDLDAWWEERIEKLPENVKKVFPFLIVPKPSKSEKNKGCENLEKQDCAPASPAGAIAKGIEPPREKRSNFHPTVKPIKLFSYLLTLGSKTGDTVLDPFMGSGTTGIACKILNREFIGIELDKDYFKIAEERIHRTERELF